MYLEDGGSANTNNKLRRPLRISQKCEFKSQKFAETVPQNLGDRAKQ